MGDQRVLVAFANQAGSTAGIADEIAAVLRRAGLAAECRLAGEVTDVTPYRAVILGSGVFLPRRRSDGGGFLARHDEALAARPVWLFSAGPIGGGRCSHDAPGDDGDDCSVSAVARAVGARGSATFGPIDLPAGTDPVERLGTVDHHHVQAWAAEIAAGLRADQPHGVTQPPKTRRSVHHRGPIATVR